MENETNCLSPYNFTNWACEQVRDGYGFVPFIGSGVSAKSGILMGVEFTEYLAWTVYRCVASPEGAPIRRRLDLRRDGWPMEPRPNEVLLAKKWIWNLFERACSDCGLIPHHSKDDLYCVADITFARGDESRAGLPFEAALRRPLVPEVLKCCKTPNFDATIRSFFRTLEHEEYLKTFRGNPAASPTSLRYVEECAIRSLSDWRSTLEFLSRLKHHRGGHICIDDAVDQAVVDSFNLHITRGRKPNLAHGMICHLASRARMRTILTTNFDTLLEDAFAQLGENYAVFPVSLNGDLPPPDSVHAQNCIVKLHGGLSETRANHSLDDSPSDEDKRRFFHYIRGCYPEETPRSGGFLPSHLLVCGYSGSDMRCVQMIKYLLDSDRNAQVFWICHSHRDVRRLHDLFEKEGYGIASDLTQLREQRGGRCEGRHRLIVTVSPRTDLLLYEFYQRLALTLPCGGLSFPLSHNVPPEESFASEAEEEQISRGGRDLEKAVLEERNQQKLIVAEGPSGLTAPLRQAFNVLTRQRKLRGVWLELDPYADVWSLAHAICEQIALQLGRFQLDHARFMPDMEVPLRGGNEQRQGSEKEEGVEQRGATGKVLINGKNVARWREYIERLLTCWNIDPSNWLIVLNGRNAPGTGAGWGSNAWGDETYSQVGSLISALLTVQRPQDAATGGSALSPQGGARGFRVLYAPYNDARLACDKENEQAVEDYIKHYIYPRAGDDSRPDSGRRGSGGCGASEQMRRKWRITERQGISSDSIVGMMEGSVERVWVQTCREPMKGFGEYVGAVAQVWFEPDASTQYRELLRRRRFLYAITLFRHARHLSAFLGEGVFPAPCEFGVNNGRGDASVINVGLDNDWRRWAEVGQWLRLLNEEHRVLLCTPGAHAWMHRDARDALWHIAEELPHWDVERPEAVASCCSTYDSAFHTRARTHFWIGQWYLRGFCTTGHAVPLLEALFHFAECVKYAPYAGLEKPDEKRGSRDEDESEHRRRLARHALCEMIKSLRLAGSTVEYWIQPAAGDAWFSMDSVERLRKDLSSALDKVGNGARESRDPFQFEGLLDLLVKELRGFPNLDPERGNIENPTKHGHQQRSDHGRGMLPREEFSEISHRLSAKQREGFRPKEDLQNKLQELLGDRCQPVCHPVIEKLTEFAEFLWGCSMEPYKISGFLRELRNRLIRHFAGSGGVLATARALCEVASLYVHNARSLELVYGFEYQDTDPAALPWFSCSSSEQWLRVSVLCRLARELCFDVDPTFTVDDFRVRTHALTLGGLALGHLGRFFEAHRYFNDAHALLTKVEGAVKQPDVVPIYLRSAEVHIVEAHVLRRFAALLPPELLENKNGGWCLNREVLEKAVQLRGGGESGNGKLALQKVSCYMEDDLDGLLAFMRKRGGEEWLMRTIEFLNEGGRRDFFEALAATLLAPSLDHKGEVSSSATEAAVIAAAQYFHIYLGHLQPTEMKGNAGDGRVFWEKCRHTLLRQHFAKLDDAWMSLEAAEQGLSGRSHRSWWWGKLYSLQLLVYSEHALVSGPEKTDGVCDGDLQIPRTLAFRNRRDFIRRIERIYSGARAASPLTKYASLTAVHHAARAVFRFFEAHPAEYDADQVEKFLEFLRRELETVAQSRAEDGSSDGKEMRTWSSPAEESAREILQAYGGKVRTYFSEIEWKVRARKNSLNLR